MYQEVTNSSALMLPARAAERRHSRMRSGAVPSRLQMTAGLTSVAHSGHRHRLIARPTCMNRFASSNRGASRALMATMCSSNVRTPWPLGPSSAGGSVCR